MHQEHPDPVTRILGYLAAGSSADQIVAEFPELVPDDIAACLDYDRDLAEGHGMARQANTNSFNCSQL
jgi:uncharacterized protein (DUF433 family)